MICHSEGKSYSIMFFHIIVVFLMTFLYNRADCCETNCTDAPEFTPSRLVVKYNDPASAVCSVCEECRKLHYDVEKPMGDVTKNGSSLHWKVNSMESWSTEIICYYEKSDSEGMCCSELPIFVYQPPKAVSLSFVNHNGPVLEGDRYTLQCEVQDVAPVTNLTVTFYRGQTELSQRQSAKTEAKEPVNETFTVEISPSKDDDGAQYRCEAKLHLGPEGPEPAPVVTSETITVPVLYKPRLVASMPSGPVTQTVPEGDNLQLNCSVVGNPDPSYKWTVPSHGPSPSNNSSFIINSATSEHSGLYTCVASNTLGDVTVIFDVKVKETPKVESRGTSNSMLTHGFTALIDMGCVTRKSLVKAPKPSLFSRPVRQLQYETKAKLEEPDAVFFEPTLCCCLRLSQVLPSERHWNYCVP